MKLPPCEARRQLDRTQSDIFHCTHPQVHIPGNRVTAEICGACRFCIDPGPNPVRRPGQPRSRYAGQPCVFLGKEIDLRKCKTCQGSVRQRVFACHHPNHEETTLLDCSKCPDFKLTLETVTPFLWAVGVTTAPRMQPTLERCLESLSKAGWKEPQLFAEPETEIPERYNHLLVSRRPATLGAFPNWYLALAELVMRVPHADAYFVCQDDVLFSCGLRSYLEQTLWPAEKVGVVSVYCASHYSKEKSVGFHVQNEGWGMWGALAYLFPNPSARALLTHKSVVNHRLHGPFEGRRNIDSVVGRWCEQSKLPFYIHYPSLAEHIGETSTLWTGGITAKRRAGRFLEDATELSETAEEKAPT